MPRRLTLLIATTVPAALLATVPLAPAPAQPPAPAGGCRGRSGAAAPAQPPRLRAVDRAGASRCT